MFTQSKKDLAEIRHFLITETDFCEYEPNLFISISYLQDYSRDQLLKIHKRLDDVVRDTFDPYEMNIICIGYFLEKGKKKLVEQKHLKVLNTISDSYEYDKEMTLKDGSYGTHLVLTLCPSILDKPNNKDHINEDLKKVSYYQNNTNIFQSSATYKIGSVKNPHPTYPLIAIQEISTSTSKGSFVT